MTTPVMSTLTQWAKSAPFWQRLGIACLLGITTVGGFAPFYLYWLPWLTIAGLLMLWHFSEAPLQAFKLGLVFGLGLYCFGIYWIYISLHTFGEMPGWFAGLCTFLLCLFMALFPAVTGYIAKRLQSPLWIGPVLWALADWTRSWIFTGFPWLTLGYTQAPDSALAGYLPVIGVYGVSALTGLMASGLLQFLIYPSQKIRNSATLAIILMVGSVLSLTPWTTVTGKPINVALLQGNISQTIKWSPAHAQDTLQRYLDMVRQVQDSQLIILPETALSMVVEEIDPAYLKAYQAHAQKSHGDVLFGVIESRQSEYFNSAMSVGSSATQYYAKNHLVPFGEFIPFKGIFGWIYQNWLHMPLSDLSRGHSHKPLLIAGQEVGVNICYEDVFGEEIAKQLPEAKLLVNMSNDAWYGQSFAADQHMQFSQVRALETGRMVLRSTNTGATAIIDKNGQILQHAPHDQALILQGQAQGYEGATPYVRWGNYLFLLLSGLIVAWSVYRKNVRH